LPLLIDDTEDLTLWQMRSRAIAAKAQHPNLGLIVVDYLQLVRADLDNRNANREQEVSVISRAGKALSKQLDCTLLMLAQLNRACEARSDKRPMMSDLRESGAIEQDADVVTFLYRDEVYNKSTPDAGVAEVLVAKNRSGVCGTVRTKFDARFTRFADLGEEPVAPAPRRNVPATRDPREPDDYDF
jgi:replicative DNA helicase